jgi:hypothetical protein
MYGKHFHFSAENWPGVQAEQNKCRLNSHWVGWPDEPVPNVLTPTLQSQARIHLKPGTTIRTIYSISMRICGTWDVGDGFQMMLLRYYIMAC